MANKPSIIIGTRGSDLALWQAHHVKKQIEDLGCQVSIVIIETQGDKIQDLSFDKLEGKGFFTKEIESALLNKEIDLAVHSHKDLETKSPDGLAIAAVSIRECPDELLIIRKACVDSTLKFQLTKGANIGTSSARRQSLIRYFRPDLSINELRGNVPTRIQKLRDGKYDAIIIAKAGVTRLALDLTDLVSIVLDPKEFVPAPAQGVLGLQVRSDDKDTYALVHKLNHAPTQSSICIERDVLSNMDGGCQLPLGVYNDGEVVHVSYAKSKLDPATLIKFPIQAGGDIVSEIVDSLKLL